MKNISGCACGCRNKTNTTKQGQTRRYLQGHNRLGKGRGWIECGYRYISVDGKKIAEHRYIVEQREGRKLTSNEVIHHINHDKSDNRLTNLAVLSRAEHTRLHSMAKRKRWTVEEKRRARELKGAGYSTQDVARMLGRGMTSTIRYACDRATRPRQA